MLSKAEEDLIEESSAESLLQKLDDLCELEYIVGEAETLHTVFPRDSIDCIISIESSNCYGDLNSFFRSNFLMLKNPADEPEKKNETGLFLYADYFEQEQIEGVKKLLMKYFNVIKAENITPNVFHSVKIDGQTRKNRICNSVSWYARPLCKKYELNVIHPLFCMYKDSYEDFKNKKKVYYAFVLQKKDNLVLESEVSS